MPAKDQRNESGIAEHLGKDLHQLLPVLTILNIAITVVHSCVSSVLFVKSVVNLMKVCQ